MTNLTKLLNTKSIAVATASLITVVVVGYFIADHNNSKARREAFGSMCPKTREVQRDMSSTYREAIRLGLYDTLSVVELKPHLDQLSADVR